MQPIEILLKNYKSYGNSEVSMPLGGNVVRLFVGENGQGKTSLIDAIIWCLYGRSLCNSDEVVNRRTKANCKVEFVFRIGENEFSVVRYRKHEVHKNKVLIFKNKKNISPIRTNDCQYLINDILGITYNGMVSSVIFSSELYNSFLRSKGTDRLKVFENILSLRDINKWAETTKKLRKPVTEKIEEKEKRKLEIGVGIDTLTKGLSDYKENAKKTILYLKEEREVLLREKKELEKSIAELEIVNYKTELDKNAKYREITGNNNEIDDKIKIEKAKLHDLSDKAKELSDFRMKLDNNREINTEKELKKIEEYNKSANSNAIIKEKIFKKKLEIVDATSLEIEIGDYKNKVKSKKVEIETLAAGECPTCGQLVNAISASSLIKERQKEIEEYEKNIAKLETDINNAEIINDAVAKEVLRLQEGITELTENSVYDEKFLRTLGTKNREIKTRIEVLETEMVQEDRFNKEIKERIKSLKDKRIDEIPEKSKYEDSILVSIEKEIEDKKQQILRIEEQARIINEKAKSAYDKKYVDDVNGKINSLTNGLKKVKKELEKVEVEDSYYAALLRLFSNKDSGIKKYVISKMIYTFNNQINNYLPLFFDYELALTFDKNLIETITIEDEEVSFDTFSSGEKTRLEIAIAFSLFMLVKTFFSSTISFIVFDEILDMNLDEEGVKRVLSVIDSLKDNNSIVVISHKKEYKESFQNHIIISRDKDGFSKVKIEG